MDAFLPVQQESNSRDNDDVPKQDCHMPQLGESVTVGTCSDRLARLERSGARKRS
jgi:hypothetical protein